jgi:hypothetical protein
MTDKEDYLRHSETYRKVSDDAKNQLTALSISILAAIYFFIDSKGTLVNVDLLIISLIFLILTMIIQIIGSYSKSQHYAAWIDGKIKGIDYRESAWGRISERAFWITPLCFLMGVVFFFCGVCAKPQNIAPESSRHILMRDGNNSIRGVIPDIITPLKRGPKEQRERYRGQAPILNQTLGSVT